MKVTASMMVRDEEKNIRRCLESIKNFADDIVIVDTGSKDRTMEICREYTESIHEHPWENDFSAHRNQSLAYAPADTDWHFIIDADEELAGDVGKFREHLEKIPESVTAVAVELMDMLRTGRVHARVNSSRFFRKDKVKYLGIVHNYPQFEGNPLVVPGVQLKHWGYDIPKEERIKKRERTIPLLKKRLEANSHDYQAWFYLAQSHGELNDLEQAVYWGSRYADAREQISNFNPSIYYLMIVACTHLADWERAERYIGEYMRHCPNDLDCAKATLDYGIIRQNAFLVMEGSIKFVQAYDRYMQDLGSRGGRFVFNLDKKPLSQALYNLTVICMKDGMACLDRLLLTLDEIEDEVYRQKIQKRVAVELEAINVNWSNEYE